MKLIFKNLIFSAGVFISVFCLNSRELRAQAVISCLCSSVGQAGYGTWYLVTWTGGTSCNNLNGVECPLDRPNPFVGCQDAGAFGAIPNPAFIPLDYAGPAYVGPPLNFRRP